MKKITLILIFLAGAAGAALAQENNEVGSATQSTSLVMSDAIEITFNSNGSETGGLVNMSFEDINDYANGVESAPIELKIRSNKQFDVQAKASDNRFSYTGNSTDPRMNVNKLKIKVVSNNTGGSVPNSVNNKYSNISKNNKKLINNGTAGGDNTFAIQYKADPGYEFPAGTYSIDIIYTATQD